MKSGIRGRASALPGISIVAVVLTLLSVASAGAGDRVRPAGDNAVLRWNTALLQAVRNVRFSPPLTSRALAIVHTCIYDAWAAYDPNARGTRMGSSLRRPRQEHTRNNKKVAVSHAAYRALADVFPSQVEVFDAVMRELDLDPRDDSTDRKTPAGIGNIACDAVLAWRHHDGSNQLGDINGGAPYSDYTGYAPVNSPTHLGDPNRWQPLPTPTGAPQTFLLPHWSMVIPFALRAANEWRPVRPHMYPEAGYLWQAEGIRKLSARLGDREKVIAEYWADGPATETPPGHWSLLAQWVSRRDRHDLDDDVKMFFALGNAMLDASVAVWDAKVAYDTIRPVSALRFLYAGQMIDAWAGPFQGTGRIRGEDFRSYIATPPFGEFVSGHSGFSAAAAAVLTRFTGSTYFGASHVFRAGTSTIEPGATPARDVTLHWHTFDDAADEAGMSRRYGGIHFRLGDVESRRLGKRVGDQVYAKAKRYWGR